MAARLNDHFLSQSSRTPQEQDVLLTSSSALPVAGRSDVGKAHKDWHGTSWRFTNNEKKPEKSVVRAPCEYTTNTRASRPSPNPEKKKKNQRARGGRVPRLDQRAGEAFNASKAD